jgi:MFS family permease
LLASLGALIAGVLCAVWYHDGPHGFERRPFDWHLIKTVVKDQKTRLAIGGYLGHMWELYAMWTLVAVFFYDKLQSTSSSGVIAFLVIASGALGSVMAGTWADRFGRERVTIYAMVVSGACSLLMGWLFSAPLALVVAVALIWGFSIVCDSAQFSAIVTEVAPRHAVGTALTLQTSLGFLLTAFTIWFAIRLHAVFDWRAAFSMLAIGPVLGILSMLQLLRVRSRSAISETAANN